MSRRRRALVGAAALAAAGAAFALGLGLARVAGRASDVAPPGAPAPAVATAPGPRTPTKPAPGVETADAPPPSLRDVEPDGDLFVDAAGHFVPTREARLLFDHFLVASGEEPEARLRTRIRAAIRARLAPPASDQAEALLDRYLGYRDAVRDLFARGEAPADLERRLQWLRELRRATLGPEAARAFFADEEARVARALERRRVRLDPALEPAERAARLAALEEALPEAERARRARATAHLRLREEVDALRAEGASPAEIQALRAARVGEAAAARLAALDARRAAWEARVAAWRAERDALRAAARAEGADAEAVTAALDARRRARFAGPELRRVAALDALERERAEQR